jgi:hypothetical protein
VGRVDFAGFAYKVSNKVNGKGYIGITTGGVDDRWKQHCKSKKHKRAGLGAAIRKYGANAFAVETIVQAETIGELLELERDLIIIHGTKSPNGYNLTDGGDFPEALPIVIGGIRYNSMKHAARGHELDVRLVYSRLVRSNWTTRQAFGIDEPPVYHSHAFTLGGEHSEAERAYGLTRGIAHSRLKAGWSVEEAFGLEPSPTSCNYFGKDYESFNDAARAHGLDHGVVRARLRLDWTEEQAFGLSPAPKTVIVGALQFKDRRAAAEHFGLGADTVRGRYRLGWAVEEIYGVNPPPGSVRAAGKLFGNWSDAARAFGVEPANLRFRLKAGWTLEQALGLDAPPVREAAGKHVNVREPNGKIRSFISYAQASRFYNSNQELVKSRITLGWSIEEALEFVPRNRPTVHNAKSVEFRRKLYPSQSYLAKSHGVEVKRFEARVKRGWSIEEALDVVPRASRRSNT